MAEAVAFLISALTSLQNVSGNAPCNLHAKRSLASVSGKVIEALSALDYLSVTQWIGSGSTAISAETNPIMKREDGPMIGCRMGNSWAAGGSVDRATRVTNQHTPRRSRKFVPPSLIEFL
jgi:hypothetical protein